MSHVCIRTLMLHLLVFGISAGDSIPGLNEVNGLVRCIIDDGRVVKMRREKGGSWQSDSPVFIDAVGTRQISTKDIIGFMDYAKDIAGIVYTDMDAIRICSALSHELKSYDALEIRMSDAAEKFRRTSGLTISWPGLSLGIGLNPLSFVGNFESIKSLESRTMFLRIQGIRSAMAIRARNIARGAQWLTIKVKAQPPKGKAKPPMAAKVIPQKQKPPRYVFYPYFSDGSSFENGNFIEYFKQLTTIEKAGTSVDSVVALTGDPPSGIPPDNKTLEDANEGMESSLSMLGKIGGKHSRTLPILLHYIKTDHCRGAINGILFVGASALPYVLGELSEASLSQEAVSSICKVVIAMSPNLSEPTLALLIESSIRAKGWAPRSLLKELFVLDPAFVKRVCDPNADDPISGFSDETICEALMQRRLSKEQRNASKMFFSGAFTRNTRPEPRSYVICAYGNVFRDDKEELKTLFVYADSEMYEERRAFVQAASSAFIGDKDNGKEEFLKILLTKLTVDKSKDIRKEAERVSSYYENTKQMGVLENKTMSIIDAGKKYIPVGNP